MGNRNLSSVSDDNYENFVTNKLNSYVKNKSLFAPLCKKALCDDKWKLIKKTNDGFCCVDDTTSQPIYLYIYRDYKMEDKLLRAPKGASVLYIIHQFYGNIPPRPKNSSVKYEIHTPMLFTKQSNDLIYRLFMPESYNLTIKMCVGSPDSLKKLLANGYDPKYTETYDLSEYVYDENVIPGTYVTKHLREGAESFHDYVMKQLKEKEKIAKSEDFKYAIRNAISDYNNQIVSIENGGTIYYDYGNACVCIKKKCILGDIFQFGDRNVLIIVDTVSCYIKDPVVEKSMCFCQKQIIEKIFGKHPFCIDLFAMHIFFNCEIIPNPVNLPLQNKQ